MWSNRQKLHDAEAERARQHLPEPTMPWRAPGARVVAVGGTPGDRVGGAVSVGSLWVINKRRELYTRPLPLTSCQEDHLGLDYTVLCYG